MDINHYFGADVILSGTGDLSTIEGTLQTQQRIIRRLMTNPGDYLWHPEYGAGVGQYVGKTVAELQPLKALIVSQILLEPAVAVSPAPVITLVSDLTTLTCTIQYFDSDVQTLQTLSFSVGA